MMKSIASMLFVLAAAVLFTSNAQAGYTDGMSQYAAYHVMHDSTDPSGREMVSPYTGSGINQPYDRQIADFRSSKLSPELESDLIETLERDRNKNYDWVKGRKTNDNKPSFPNLTGDFIVIGPSTDEYNCHGSSCGTGGWTNAEDMPDLSDAGWTLSDDCSHECDIQKIAMYYKNGTLTHSAIENCTGGWTSKIGTGPLIVHDRAEDLLGPSYGTKVICKEREARNCNPRLCPCVPGELRPVPY